MNASPQSDSTSNSTSSWGRAEDLPGVAGEVAIVGVGESEHTKASGRTAKQIALEAIEVALADAKLEPDQIDGILYSPFGGDPVDANVYKEHFNLTDSDNIWDEPSGGAMVWAALAVGSAAAAFKEKRARYILNSFSVAWATQRANMVGGPGESHAQELFKQNAEVPFGWFPQPVYFATVARRHMIEYGTPPEALGAIAVAQRNHANLNPGAVMHEKPLTLDDYMASPLIADPFRKEDCCLISDGGGAYIMTTPDKAGDHPEPSVYALGLGLGSSLAGAHWAEQGDFTSTPQVFAAPKAFQEAGVRSDDIDVLAVYDPFTIVALMQLEDMGFCEKGAAGEFALAGELDYQTGKTPLNTHGGLLSHSYVLGISHIVELVRQLRGEANAQVSNPRLAAFGGYTGPQAATLILGSELP